MDDDNISPRKRYKTYCGDPTKTIPKSTVYHRKSKSECEVLENIDLDKSEVCTV